MGFFSPMSSGRFSFSGSFLMQPSSPRYLALAVIGGPRVRTSAAETWVSIHASITCWTPRRTKETYRSSVSTRGRNYRPFGRAFCGKISPEILSSIDNMMKAVVFTVRQSPIPTSVKRQDVLELAASTKR
ncbi:hypothetical protein SCLCIDRAFT_701635 [Scleroderma citrinum Foug A]|uniref:Uncharacterized protein n=1 Tax=Scleroderma citrinum Foug A TaxID=1036808 RepID=A0A0C3ENH7_9AGAM|nr:hypothetical protein SCLCIDRAFT_701635 [Scleroderma citrinum Foug A]